MSEKRMSDEDWRDLVKFGCSADEDRAEALVEAERARASEKRLAEALRKLANEAGGFLSMADPANHGRTNMNVLSLRIEEARAALSEAGHE